MTYSEIKKMHPELKSCFFAFNEQQLQEGIKEHNLEGQKLYQGAHGLIGTKEGIANYLTFYEKREERIRTECTPQDVYNYEYWNHECDYVGDDEEAVKIVISIYGNEIARTIKRKYAFYSIPTEVKE
ncbi:hypothetical protein GOQ04_03330 [Emticicia sp. ODNR4P]|nr:hypothetical protein [Emticicia sp. ODNR4P]